MWLPQRLLVGREAFVKKPACVHSSRGVGDTRRRNGVVGCRLCSGICFIYHGPYQPIVRTGLKFRGTTGLQIAVDEGRKIVEFSSRDWNPSMSFLMLSVALPVSLQEGSDGSLGWVVEKEDARRWGQLWGTVCGGWGWSSIVTDVDDSDYLRQEKVNFLFYFHFSVIYFCFGIVILAVCSNFSLYTL